MADSTAGTEEQKSTVLSADGRATALFVAVLAG
jgi:hypothetical protein